MIDDKRPRTPGAPRKKWQRPWAVRGDLRHDEAISFPAPNIMTGEMLTINDAIREVIMTRPASNQIRQASGEGFITMRQDGYHKVLTGKTTLEEVWRVTQDVETNGNGHHRPEA